MATQDAPTYTESNMITGICLWEAFLALTATPQDDGDDGDDGDEEATDDTGTDATDADPTSVAGEMFDGHGSYTIRAALISLVKPCEEAWTAHSAGKDDGEQFDWDWCPRFLRGAISDGSLAEAIEGQYRP